MSNGSRILDRVTVSRRRAIAVGTGILAGGMAGCPDDGGASGATEPTSAEDNGTTADESDSVVVASFFSFYDFGRKVANGTPLQVKNLVPTGLHGHGWEPDASVTRDIIEADDFIEHRSRLNSFRRFQWHTGRSGWIQPAESSPTEAASEGVP